MKLFIFLVFLAITYGHHGDPDQHGDQNCSQQCQDQCSSCENLCREQTLSSSQKDCQTCQQQCQQCLTSCHDGEHENGECGPNEVHAPDCNNCHRSCKDGSLGCTEKACGVNSQKGCVCKIGYHAGKNGICVPCEKSSINTGWAKKECGPNEVHTPDCNNCYRSCEYGSLVCTLMACGSNSQKGCVCKIGYYTGKNGACVPCEKSIIDNNDIHLAAHFVDRCSLCMTQCKACQVQCIGSQRQDCGDCQQKCQFCREMCHPRSKRYDYAHKQPLPNCQRMCESLCSNGKSEDCQFCLRECESGFVGHQKLGKLDVGQDVQSDQNESGQQQGGQHLIPLGSCRKCMTYCNLCEVQCKNSKLEQPNCDRCHERCSQCREMCSSSGQSGKNDSEQSSQQLIPLGSCRKCMTYCNLCEVQCKNSKLEQPNCDRCHERCSQCREMCSSDGEDQPVGQGGEKGNDQEVHGDHLGSQICQQCKEICARGLGQPCQDCLKQCDQGQGGVQDQEQQGGQGHQIGSPSDEQGEQGHHPDRDCLQKCQGVCTTQRGQALEGCQDCLNKCQQEGQGGHQRGHHNQRCQACKISCNFCLTHCQSQGDKNCESCHSSCNSCKEICQVSPDQGQREKRQSNKCQKMCEVVCRRDQGCTQCLHHCLNNGGGR